MSKLLRQLSDKGTDLFRRSMSCGEDSKTFNLGDVVMSRFSGDDEMYLLLSFSISINLTD
jgi:hypothetical protein